MNTPPYIVVDEFGVKNAGEVLTAGILYNVQQALNLPVLNYQYGYWRELKETLKQMESPGFDGLKYPLVWLTQPFTIDAGKILQFYGSVDELRIFIIGSSSKTYKAAERMTNVYKPLLYPIFNELKKQIALSKAFIGYENQMKFKVTDRYYWGDDKPVIDDDVVDIMEAKFFNIKIQNNLNC